MNTPSRLLIRDWSKRFGTIEVLRGLTLTVEPGEWLSLIGPSGCGKTTVLRCLAGFESPDSGTALLGAMNLLDMPPQARPIHTVFQNYALFPHLNVFENVAFGLRVKGLSRVHVQERVSQILEQVRMTGFESRMPQELSGGQQQRVALARALILQPQVLLLDEPLGALDAGLRRTMQMELKRLQRELGFTCILVTHDQEEALRVSDRIALLKSGVIDQCDRPHRLYRYPVSKYAASFLGHAHFLPVTLRKESDAWRVEYKGMLWMRSRSLENAWESMTPAAKDAVISCWLCLRPEEWELENPSEGVTQSGDRVRLQGQLQGLVFQGETWRAHVQLGAKGREGQDGENGEKEVEAEVVLGRDDALVWSSVTRFPMTVHLVFSPQSGTLLPPEPQG